MDVIGLIAAHGYWIVLVVAFVDQFGAPIPSIAVLLAAGAVAGQGQITVIGVLGAALLGTVAGDVVLYQAGRWRGGPVMCGLCSFSLAPDTCVRKTADSFQRLGWKALVVAKFVPGLALFAAPVAGTLRMPFAPFLTFDVFLIPGAFFAVSDQFSCSCALRRLLSPPICRASIFILRRTNMAKLFERVPVLPSN